jgi:hypothetical protein
MSVSPPLIIKEREVAMATTMNDPHFDVRITPRMSWSALLVGTVVALAIELMLGLLGAGIGFSSLDPAGNGGPSAGGLGIGAIVWWTLSTVIALGAGAFAAATISHTRRPIDGVLHGVAIWGLTLLLTFYLLSSAIGGLVGGAFRTVGGLATAATAGASVVTPTVAKAAGIDDMDVDAQVSALLNDTPSDPAQMTPEQGRKAIVAELPTMARGGAEGQEAENRIAAIIAAQQKISQSDARAKVEKARQDFIAAKKSAVDTAVDAGAKGADYAAGTAFALFLVMLLGAGAAAVGGVAATRRNL